MKYVLVFTFILTSMMLKSQVISVDNGFSYSSTKYNSMAKCNHNSYSMFISIDYLQNKNYYISSQIGYLSTGYFAYTYDYAGGIDDSHKLISDEIHINTTFRYRVPINHFYAYVGLGPKMDYSFNKREGIKGNDLPKINNFKNMFGVKVDLGICWDLNRVRLGLNAAYISNLNQGEYDVNKYRCGLSIGYILDKK